jgi:membrane associated rhomboid family serine protease
MTPASVGFHCPECTTQGAKQSRTVRFRDMTPDKPIATMVIIGLNVAAFVAMSVVGRSFMRPTGDVYVNGVLFGPLVDQGEWWRVITGGFLHSGVFHLAMNMLLLWLLGQMLEPMLGRFRFVTLYVACLVAGSFGVLLVSPNSPTIGASGAVFGLMGVAVIAQRRDGINVWRNGIGGLVVINLVLTFMVPGISVGGHVGGLIGGIVIGAVVFALDRVVRTPWVGAVVTMAITVVLYAGCLWAAGNWMDPVINL